jgi:hypothetical protein
VISPREVTLGVVDGRRDTEKLELVCVEAEAGRGHVELRLLAWSESLGWYRQRTLPVPADPAPLRSLLRRAEPPTRTIRARATGGRGKVVAFRPRASLSRPASA